MFTNSKLTKSIRLAMAVGTVAAISSSNVYAQETEASVESVEKISVTGSRIQKANLVSASPVVEISAEDIAVSGVTRIEDLLNDMPQIFGGQNSGTANGATGTATVDLRNLGSNRTLTLVNGRRMPAGSPVAGGIGGDVNQIPAGLVERIEVLTGGASATYGSDAVAGVVNFIMKDDFEGVQFDYQHSFYQHDNDNAFMQGLAADSGFDFANGSVKDGHANDFSVLLGANTADGRGNVTMYASYRNIQAVSQSSRDYSACAVSGSPLGCVGSGTIAEGRITDFGLNGVADPLVNLGNTTSFDFKVQGDEFVPRDGTTYNYGPLNYFQRPDVRKTFGALGHYDINDNHTVYAEANFMDNRSVAQIAPSGAFFVTTTLDCANPLLSQQQFDVTCGANGLTTDDVLGNAYIGRRNVEGNPRQDDLRHTSFRGVVGARGFINDNWSYDIFANYGTTSFIQTYRNELSITRIGRAFDAVTDPDSGEAVCRSAIPDANGVVVDSACVPWNVFSSDSVTQEALGYVTLPLFARGDVETTQVSGYVAGDLTDLGFVVPGTSTGVNVVVGFERREETLDFEPDQGFESGDGAGQGGPTLGVSGGFTVEELFAEASIPLVQDVDFMQELNLELAYRYSDYSTDKSTNTYKYAADWKVNDDVRVRASFQRAVRAGNVRELFRAQSLGLFNMNNDPCAADDDGNIEFTREQCINTGLSGAAYDAGGAPSNPAGQYNQITGGNPDLEPEESDTVSYGIVYAPSDMPGFSLALDYFDIDVTGAIGGVSSEFIIRECGTTGNEEFCSLINRGGSGSLWLGQDSVTSTDINLGFFATAGVDFDAAYEFGIGDMGDIKLNLVGTFLTKWDQKNTPSSDVVDCLGKWDRSICGVDTAGPTPEMRYNLRTTWISPWDVTVTGTMRYVDGTDELNGGDNAVSLKSKTYFDLTGNWNAFENASFRLGVNNLFDVEPQVIGNAPAGSANGNVFPGPYDVLGRYVFMGVSVSY
ncbi:TonB-dependent outer membrane receptor [Paraglaciecola mesophila KMM 241]|uniref:TonB-dependent outer membrane receptor n=1 Tax=Paraglaciecola mesophila KMM 241 TaxID=1128912 RepID=K6YNE5_9ALTE|nr:TonB-dependent receptor [Paraglaciecola mesophila]GAC25516.1 TonB-dependent outer membrane receptor [Paraglaciecola mesophila KMM 241]